MINKVVLTGRLTSDIELRRTNDGIVYAYFTLAVNRISRNETDFISCVAWRSSAELMSKYLKKGSLVGVEGRLEVYRLNQNDGYQTRTNVNVSQVYFLESRQQSQQSTTSNINPQERERQNFTSMNSNQESSNDDEIKIDDINFDDINF